MHGSPITVDLAVISDVTQYLEKLFVAASYLRITNLVYQIKVFSAKMKVDMEYTEMDVFVSNNLSTPTILDSFPDRVESLPIKRRNYDDSKPGKHRDVSSESPRRYYPSPKKDKKRDFGPDLEIQLAQDEASDDAESYAPPTPERVVEPNFEGSTWRDKHKVEKRRRSRSKERRSRSPARRDRSRKSTSPRKSRSPRRRSSPDRRGGHARPNRPVTQSRPYERRTDSRDQRRKSGDSDRRPYFG